MRMKIGRNIWNFIILIVTLAVMMQGALALVGANLSEPSYIEYSSEVIDVDGNNVSVPYGEWNTGMDFFADMNEIQVQGEPNSDLLSNLYLRYDCTNGILYAMVLLNDFDNHVINVTENEMLFVKVNKTDNINQMVLVNNGIVLVNGNTDDGGTAPDLHYITVSNKIIGWEASAPLAAGTYRICVRTQVDTSTGVKTSGTGSNQYGIPLKINCGTTPIPEFPTVALPVAAIIGLMFLFGRKRDL